MLKISLSGREDSSNHELGDVKLLNLRLLRVLLAAQLTLEQGVLNYSYRF